MRPTFRWKVPLDLTPQAGEGHPVEDAEIVRWFVARWSPGAKLEGTPLGRVLAAVDSHHRGDDVAISLTDRAAWSFIITGLRRLAWGIRALHGRDGVADVHASFVSKELLAADFRDAHFAMPQGIGVVVLAGRLIQGAGGRVSILGNGVKGHDIRWEQPAGGVVLIERKDRAYERGVGESAEASVEYVCSKIVGASDGIPDEPGAARVLSVGLPMRVEPEHADALRLRLARAIDATLLGRRVRVPDLVVVEAISPATDDQAGVNFFSPHEFPTGRPAWNKAKQGVYSVFTSGGGAKPY